jgi:hypothetical protein
MGTKGFVKGQALLRGNRFYLTMTTSAKGTDGSGINQFLNSLKFVDYQTTAFKEYELKDKGIKVKFPSAYQVDTTEQNLWRGDKDRIIYNALDDNTGVAYILVVDKLSDYEQYEDREHFFEKTNDGYKSDGDSIIQKTDFTYKGFMAQDVIIQRKKSNAIKKVRTILNGHNLYEMIAFLPADYLQSKTPMDEFFNSLQVAEADKWNLFSDKTDRILKDISSLDTLAQEASSMALSSHDFKVSDLPKLYKALSCSYPDDSLMYGGVKLKLLRKLRETNDASTIKFITDFYATLSDSSVLKNHALSVLSEMKSEVATQQLLAILKNDKHDDFSSYVILNPYYDSLALSSSIASNVTMLESKFESPSYLFNLIQAALDSGEFSADLKKGVIESLVKLGFDKTAQPIKLNKTDDDYYKRSDYFQGLAGVLSTIPFNSDVKKILSGIHQCGDASVMLITSKALFVNNVEVSVKDLEVIAADPLYRLKLYEMLKEVSKEKLFPAKFLTQQKLSESALVEYFDYEDGVPENIAFLEKKVVKYNSEKVYVYCYKYKYEGDDDWYIALSGPYPLKSTEIILRGDFTFSTYEVYGKDKIDNIINAALKEYGAEVN